MPPQSTQKQIHNITYCTGAHPEIRAQYRKGNRPTEFGNKVWATSLVLMGYLAQQPFPLPFAIKRLRVLEVGCGWGLLGVYLAKSHGCRVTCTDLDKHVLPIVELHARLNNVTVETQQASFNDLSQDFLRNFDIIIGAEICYSEEIATEIIHLMQRAFDASVAHVLIGDPGRPDFDDCYAECKQHFQTTLHSLPGSVNGKTTTLLHAHKP